MSLHPLDPADIRQAADLWNAACGQDLAITERLVRYNLAGTGATEAAGCLAVLRGRPAGWAAVSATSRRSGRAEVAGLAHPAGWIDALAVHPGARRQGLGSDLLAWAERWLAARGCPSARLGGGPRPFAPGLPAQLGSEAFFSKRGYAPRPRAARVWDVARSLEDYATPDFVKSPPVEIRPLRTGETEALDRFLAREFPDRWRFEFQEGLRLGEPLADYLALWTGRGVDAFCWLATEESARPVERYYPHGLPRPWGQLGPIGVSADRRGQGYGSALLDAGLRRLRDRGVAGCVIDWTDLPDYYGRFGFRRHREYLILIKELR